MDIGGYQVIFWDFDGVIKDSVNAKTKGYIQLFDSYGTHIKNKIFQHHIEHGGVSRFEKIPLYYKKYLKTELSAEQIQELCLKYGEFTKYAVLKSEWVPGVRKYLELNCTRQTFFVVTGTPQEDINWIINKLDIQSMFFGVYGAPKTKIEILSNLIEKYDLKPESCLMVGDALTDYNAAKKTKINFLLRKTPENEVLFKNISCNSIDDFMKLI
ncbi:HAD-superfamily hydrolase, subfamily IA, variant 1 [Desulfobacula toluolica Tol2]|uniref:phosphoglycolate phosphatase n=2 Tax=Desulfobacula toluolica TaxID=28223 RepID=K0NNG9_DESTT|nr:HAD-superfamily hydrolase, subfamily IA, variant 1 [Desulfobacula toluolica Tol2]